MKISLLSIFTLFSFCLSGQLNVELLSNLTYDSAGNDIWGYVAPDGSEYAIFGTFDGVSVVNVTDPRNPEEVDFIEQQGSMWRDMKTWGEFAYCVADAGGTNDGLLVIDMSTLPDSISYVNINPTIPGGARINRCHNIYIDEFGFAYLSGCNVNSGGLVIFDVDTTPGDPILSGLAPNEYSHDVYVRDNMAYSAEINIGVFSVYDVTDKSNITLLAQQSTPFNFTHNLWLSDDGNTIFTTDELGNAPVASYDISDLSDIKLLDEYRPSATLNTGVIPHNVHVWDDWLIISYYSDGCIIVDASKPDNLVEVGNFDTFLPNAQGFNGAWGAYPFLPSGNILIGDVNSGLFVLGPTYVRAAHLEGTVTDATTGAGINNASITVDELDLIDFSKADGQYKTGSHTSGTFTVSATAFGYDTQSRDIDFENGQLTMADFQLNPLPRVDVQGQVVDADTQEPVADSKVKMSFDGFEVEAISDENGNFTVPSVLVGSYNVIAGQWGYKYSFIENYEVANTGTGNVVRIELEKGYEDVFSLDLGWQTSLIGGQGIWERGDPIGQSPAPDVFIAPEDDSDDMGVEAYVTGNVNDFFGGLLFGETILTSPSFNVTSMTKPALSYQTWVWISDFNGNPASEEMYVSLSNGTESVIIDTVVVDFDMPFEWVPSGEIIISDYITPSDSMTITVTIAEVGGNSAVEGGFDDFQVYDAESVSVDDIVLLEGLNVLPNPTNDRFYVQVPETFQQSSRINVYLTNGQLVESINVNGQDQIEFGSRLLKGMYLIQMVNQESRSQVMKVIKL